MTGRPAFELEAQEAPRTRERIDMDSLTGETILYVFTSHQLEGNVEYIVITENFNWMTLAVEGDGDDASISDRPYFGYPADGLDKLAECISPEYLHVLADLGLSTRGEVEVIRNKRNAEKAERLRAHAERMRRQADALTASSSASAA